TSRDDQGRFAAKETPKEEPAPEPEKVEATVEPEQVEPEKPKAKPEIGALIAERRKRQELEKQLEAVRAEKPKTDFFENPDKAVEERVSQETAKTSERFFHLSVKLARVQPGRDDY